MKLTVGQFCDAYFPVIDGVVMVVKNYAEILNKKYGYCCVVAPETPGYIDSDPFDIIRTKSVALPKRPPYRYSVPIIDRAAYKRLSETPFDLVHAHSPFGLGMEALRIARRIGIPVVASFHSKYYDDFKQVLKSDTMAQLLVKIVVDYYRHVDQVWTVNKSTAMTLKEYGYKGNVEIVPNGTDIAYPDNPDELVERVNEKYKLSRDERIFLFVGQHIWQKNLKNLIEAMAVLKKMDFKFKLIMVGKGYAEKDLKKLAMELGLAADVIFAGVVSDRKELSGLYLRAELFVFPSVYDNAPLVVKEAATMKTPSLLIKDSNAAEGVTDNINGFLCDDGSANIAQRIVSIYNSGINIKEVGENAARTLARSWDSIVDEVYLRYMELIKFYDNKDRKNYIGSLLRRKTNIM